MKIYMITASDLGIAHGPTIHFMNLAEHLASQHVSIDIFAPRLGRFPEKTDVTIHYIPTLKIKYLAHACFQIPLFFVLLWHTIKHQPDCIYTRTSFFTGISSLVAWLCRIPHIAQINAIQYENVCRDHRNLLLRYIIKWLEQYTARASQEIIMLTEGMKNNLCDLYHISPVKIDVVPAAADENMFYPIDHTTARQHIHYAQDRPLIGYMGTLDHWQDVDMLIRALPFVRNNIPNAQCIIVGDGLLKPSLISLSSQLNLVSCVSFVERQPYHMMPYFINACDVCVIPRRLYQAGYSPIKLYEYMACGRPVVATRIPGFDILETYQAGILVTPNSPEDLAHGIIRMLQDPVYAQQLGLNGRKTVIQHYTWTKTAEKIAQICHSTVKRQTAV